MKHKKLICLLLSLIFCFAMVPMTAMAAEAPEGVWTDYAADSFESGTGTQTDPYVIATAEQLAKGIVIKKGKKIYHKVTL